MSKTRVIMTGPLPPAIGGMATVIKDINDSSLSNTVSLLLMNTAKTTPEGRSILQAIKTRLQLLLHCAKLLKGPQNTILHIHTCSGLTYFLDATLLLVGKLMRIPVVLHIHGGRFDQFLDELSWLTLGIARWIARHASRVVVLSESWQMILSQKLPGSTFLIIENGVPVTKDNSQPVNDKTADKQTQLLFLGNLSKSKGVWDLLQAVEELNLGIRLVYAGGEGEPGIAEKLQHKAEKGGLSTDYQWVGPVNGDAKQQLFRESDIFVLPSYIEGLPISLLEAMCAGLPVIATPVGGIPSVVTDRQEGLLVNPGDIQGLKHAIKELVTHPILQQKMAEHAYSTCSGKYDIEKIVAKYRQMYAEIIQSKT